MTTKEVVLDFIKEIRKYGDEVVTLFTRGYCYYFCIILKERFGDEVEIYYDVVEGHMVSKIGNSFFDITGEIEYNKYMKSFPKEIDAAQLNIIIRDVILKEKFF